MAIEYGRCRCSGRYEKRFAVVPLKGRHALQNVPEGNCPLCGSRVYNATVLRWVEAAWLRSSLDDPSSEPAADG